MQNKGKDRRFKQDKTDAMLARMAARERKEFKERKAAKPIDLDDESDCY